MSLIPPTTGGEDNTIQYKGVKEAVMEGERKG
jgi:hypothetical protein